MWIYEKKLEYPVRVSGPNPKLAKIIIEQYGGSDGELSAGVRYLTQRYTMPTGMAKGVLTDVGTEELAHFEIVGTIVYKLLKGVTPAQMKAAGMDAYYADFGKGIFPVNAAGNPWTAAYIDAKDDPIANLHEDLAAEQKARAVYENLLNLSDDPCVNDVLKFLREREVVHFQRFGEALDHVQTWMNTKKCF